MKIRTSRHHRIQGTTLVVCLVTVAIICIALASYLTMNQQEYVNVVRSQTWNRTMAVSEAGTEEAMAMINKYANTATPLTSWTNSTYADGWTTLNNNSYYLRRYVGPDYYDVYITNINNSPAIKSTGTLAWNYWYASAAPQTMFAAVGASPPRLTTSRAVLIQTAPPKSYFLYGILAKKGITITGGGTNDSVNSLNTNYLANPWSRLLEHANGSIGTIESNVVAAFGESSSTIFGHVNTGPGSTITVSGAAAASAISPGSQATRAKSSPAGPTTLLTLLFPILPSPLLRPICQCHQLPTTPTF